LICENLPCFQDSIQYSASNWIQVPKIIDFIYLYVFVRSDEFDLHFQERFVYV